jgi:hypothetical protein
MQASNKNDLPAKERRLTQQIEENERQNENGDNGQ